MTNISKMYSLKQITEKFGVPYQTIYRWIRAGVVKGKQNVNRFNKAEWYIEEEEWLLVPAYIRQRYVPKLHKLHIK